MAKPIVNLYCCFARPSHAICDKLMQITLFIISRVEKGQGPAQQSFFYAILKTCDIILFAVHLELLEVKTGDDAATVEKYTVVAMKKLDALGD